MANAETESGGAKKVFSWPLFGAISDPLLTCCPPPPPTQEPHTIHLKTRGGGKQAAFVRSETGLPTRLHPPHTTHTLHGTVHNKLAAFMEQQGDHILRVLSA